jgi:deoxyadenosine/deoxycytidine kinase
MGKLIVVVGNAGVGKTSLVNALCAENKFATGLEQHAERPFQSLFKSDPEYALENQFDYLLLRSEQERSIRNGSLPGIQDGGLDLDFHVFTRLFLKKNFLSADDFSLCKRLYEMIRSALPPPDKIIWMQAPFHVVENRFASRGRPLEIAERGDLVMIDSLLNEWLMNIDRQCLIELDASGNDPTYADLLPGLMDQLLGIDN